MRASSSSARPKRNEDSLVWDSARQRVRKLVSAFRNFYRPPTLGIANAMRRKAPQRPSHAADMQCTILISTNFVNKRNDAFGVRMCAMFNSPCSLCNEKETSRREKFGACFACLGSSPQEFTLELRNCIAIALANERTYGQTQVTQRAERRRIDLLTRESPPPRQTALLEKEPVKTESVG